MPVVRPVRLGYFPEGTSSNAVKPNPLLPFKGALAAALAAPVPAASLIICYQVGYFVTSTEIRDVRICQHAGCLFVERRRLRQNFGGGTSADQRGYFSRRNVLDLLVFAAALAAPVPHGLFGRLQIIRLGLRTVSLGNIGVRMLADEAPAPTGDRRTIAAAWRGRMQAIYVQAHEGAVSAQRRGQHRR